MNSLSNFVILCVVLRCLVSYTNAQVRVIHGAFIRIEQSPHTVSIFRNSVYQCVGCLVTMKSVVTVAHCVFDKPKTEFVVIAGITDLRELGELSLQRSDVRGIRYDRRYRPDSTHMDIAVVKVDTFVETVAVNSINLRCSPLEPGLEMRFSGWGSTAFDIRPHPLLLYTQVRIIRKCDCQKYYEELEEPITLANTITCAVSGTGSAEGLGDSGAGAVWNNLLYAVVHGGCKVPGIPILFTDITNRQVRAFLDKHIE